MQLNEEDAKREADKLEALLLAHEALQRKEIAEQGKSALEFARYRELARRFHSLPVEQQAAAFRAAGMEAEAAAVERSAQPRKPPAPTKEVRGFAPGRNSLVPTAKAHSPIAWELWFTVPKVALWEGVALALGLNPRELQLQRAGWMSGSSEIAFEPSSFPSAADYEDFVEALSFAKRATGYLAPIALPIGYVRENRAEVALRDVATFLRADPGRVLPAPLLQMLQRLEAPPEVEAEERGRGRHIKRTALIADNAHRWPNIELDLRYAAGNGLSAAARDTGKKGWWWEGSAVAWARARNKLKDAPASGVLRHRMTD